MLQVTMKSTSATVTLTASRARFASRPVEGWLTASTRGADVGYLPSTSSVASSGWSDRGCASKKEPPRPLTQRRTPAWTTRERSWKRSSTTNILRSRPPRSRHTSRWVLATSSLQTSTDSIYRQLRARCICHPVQQAACSSIIVSSNSFSTASSSFVR